MWQANLLGVDGLCRWVLACVCPVVRRLGLGVGPVVCVCARACIGAFVRPKLARFRDLWWSSVGQVAVSCKLTWAPLKHRRRSAGGVLRDALLLVADADLCNFCRGCSGLVSWLSRLTVPARPRQALLRALLATLPPSFPASLASIRRLLASSSLLLVSFHA